MWLFSIGKFIINKKPFGGLPLVVWGVLLVGAFGVHAFPCLCMFVGFFLVGVSV